MLKRYMLLEAEVDNWRDYDYTLRLKIKNGLTNEDFSDAFDIKTETWVPTGGEKLYFFPGCSVPRFKVREKFTVTIKPESADVLFIEPDQLKGNDCLLNNLNQHLVIDAEYINDYFEYVYGENHFMTIKLKSLLHNCEDKVLISLNSWVYFKRGYPKDAENLQSFKDYIYDEHYSFYKDMINNDIELQNFFTEIKPGTLASIKAPIYHQSSILSILNEGSLVINKEKFTEFCNMANSHDGENLKLVMELMANCDYEKSLVYLLMLLLKYNDKFVREQIIDSVNFKSLLEFLGLNKSQIRTKKFGMEQALIVLKRSKQFTKSNVQTLTHFIANEVNWHIHNTDNFTTGPVPKNTVSYDDDIIQDANEIDIPEENDNDNF